MTNTIVERLLSMERVGAIRLARQIVDIDGAVADMDAPPTAVLHFEGAEPIDTALDSLDAYHAAGLRSLGLVWSRPNAFAYGVPFVFPSSPDTGPGLTESGIRLTRRCAELGILIDLAHMNEAGFWDTARLELGPLVVSHAGVHAIAPCSRNVTDQQLDAIASTGGLIGVVFACSFLRPTSKTSHDNSANRNCPARSLYRRSDWGRARRVWLGFRRRHDSRRARGRRWVPEVDRCAA